MENEFEKEDMLRLLACLQSELEARETVIDRLKSERSSYVDFRAKYGLVHNESAESCDPKDPFFALHKDSVAISSIKKECDLKPLFDTQLVHLEKLILSQRSAQEKMREQLQIMERKYLEVRNELENERKKHEMPCSHGDALVLLKTERERLKSEVENEKLSNLQLAKDLKKALSNCRQQKYLMERQKQVAVQIIKERRKLLSQCVAEQKRVSELEKILCRNNIPDLTQEKLSEPCSDQSNVTLNSTANYINAPDPVNLGNEFCRLREALSREVTARKSLETKYENLRCEYDLLVSTNNEQCSTASSLSLPATSCNSCLKRFKPNPPIRWSSDATNPSLQSTTDIVSIVNGTPITSTDHSPSSTTASITKFGDVSPCDPLSVSLESLNVSSSRSSTPSPPLPPPSIQLNYPYPGMQSHLQHSRTLAGGGIPNFLFNSSRSLTGSLGFLNKPRANIVPLSSSFSPPQPNLLFHSPSQTYAINRGQSPTGHGLIDRKPIPVVDTTNFRHSSYSCTPFSTTIPIRTSPTVGLSHFGHRIGVPVSSDQPLRHVISPNTHHFGTHSPVRPLQGTQVQHTSSLNAGSARSMRNPVPSSSGSVATVGGHMCISGK